MRNVIAGVLLACVAGWAGLRAQSNPTQVELADRNWVAEFKRRAWDSLMPLASPGLVAYRGYRDIYPQEMERYFAIQFSPGPFDRDRMSATVVVPIGGSIRQQLLELHMTNRGASFESVLSQIAVRRVNFDATTCRAIRDQMDALPKVRITVPERDVLAIDPYVHRIVLNVGPLEMDATVTDETNPLVRWAVETNAALSKCDPIGRGSLGQ
jgi:hypothetical protein